MSKTPSYRLQKASGRAVVTLNGADRYLGVFGTPESRAAYDRLIAEWLANGRRIPEADADVTVVELIAAHWKHAETYYADTPNTLTNIRHAVRPLKRLYGRTRAADFGPLSLEAVRGAMIDDGLARGTINRRIGWIRIVFR